MPERSPKVALVHDWLVGQRGGEAVLLRIARLFPEAPIYTLVHAPGQIDPELEAHPILSSGIARLPGAPRHFRAYLPLFFLAVQRWDLQAYDLILSTSHCVAQGVRVRPGQVHLAYIHTPARYLYDAMRDYLPDGALGDLLLPLAERGVGPLRALDRAAAQRPTALMANSEFVAGRIEQRWGRRAAVVYPPVDVDYFSQPPAGPRPKRRGILCVGAWVPYKRPMLAVQWANRLRLPLTLVGSGPQEAALRRLAGPGVRLVSGLSKAALRRAYWEAEGLIFAGCEDFGIAPVEAMAAGCPVLGYDQGGLRETVGGSVATDAPDAGGLLVAEPTWEAFVRGWYLLQQRQIAGRYTQEVLQGRARRFSQQAFDGHYAQALAHHGFMPAVRPPIEPLTKA
jgi:glycosyltransferase involved in cell wall biosynthesis